MQNIQSVLALLIVLGTVVTMAFFACRKKGSCGGCGCDKSSKDSPK